MGDEAGKEGRKEEKRGKVEEGREGIVKEGEKKNKKEKGKEGGRMGRKEE